jgi:hypothetical protein
MIKKKGRRQRAEGVDIYPLSSPAFSQFLLCLLLFPKENLCKHSLTTIARLKN